MISRTEAAVIRLYRPSDQMQIDWLYSRTPPAGQIAWRPSPVPDDLKRIADHYASFFVAVEPIPEGEAIVGMTGVQEVGRHTADVPVPEFVDTSGPTARLRHVAVAPERWRQGIGGLVVQTAVEWARQQKYRAVILNTTPQQEAAVSLYGATGFQEVGRSMFLQWECVWFRRQL